MRDRLPLFPSLALALVLGCQALHPYRPIPVLVRDAETKEPIAGAQVHVSYPFTDPKLAPWDAVGTTRDDGIARLQAAPYGNGILMEITAPGRMSEHKEYTAEAVGAIEPAGWFESAGSRPAQYVIDLYAEPRPTVELVLRTGYRGLVRAEFQVQDDKPAIPGQRTFSYEVPSSGTVTVAGPPIVRHVFSPDLRARYADGTPLSCDAKEGEVGFWWFKSEGDIQVFVVGTRQEFESIRRAEETSAGVNHSAGGGKGGGGRRGGGARRGAGGQSSGAGATSP